MVNTRVVFNTPGDTSVLQLEQTPLCAPKASEVCVKHEAIGVNFIDTYHRSGLYPVSLPSGLGLEAAGVVCQVGDDVTGVEVGDRVAYCSGPLGAYSAFNCVPAKTLVKLPDDISFEQAAATLLKGLTAAYLLFKTTQLNKGDWILVHSAAGGVGQLLARWASSLGIRVIGTVGAAAKVKTARACGCEAVILYREVDVALAVKGMTNNLGVKVVFDGVGKDTFNASLNALQPRGLMVSFGNASGAVEDFSPLLLAAKGSLFLTRPTLGHYIAQASELIELSNKLFDALRSGVVKAVIDAEFRLEDAAQAHKLLAAGATQGALLLKP